MTPPPVRFPLALALVLLLVSLAPAWAQKNDPNRARWRQSDRPNIVLIVADDLGWGAIGSYGQKEIHTPNLDRLAAEGMRFTQAYSVSTVCAPSRCSLMTGRHTGHARIRSNDEIPLRPEDVTLGEVLRGVGYRTAAVGKWGLGWQGTTGHPRQQGFEEFYGFLGHLDAHNYYPPTLWRNEQSVPLPGNQNAGRQVYAPDEFVLAATNTVRMWQNHPFFLPFDFLGQHRVLQHIQHRHVRREGASHGGRRA